MINTVLITGFLGSGKTSFLKNFAKRNLHRKIVYLVNEFSPRDIDAELISDKNPNIVSVAGGSIFCKCLVSEFINQLKLISEKFPDAEALLIEASGMANPKVVSKMLSETALDKIYRLSQIISIVDPNTFQKLCHTLPNILAQIEASNIVLINKTDICEVAKIAECIESIKKINPACKIIKTVMANVDIDLVSNLNDSTMDGKLAECKDANFATFSTDYPFSRNELSSITDFFADDIFRIKGWINSCYMDFSGERWNYTDSKKAQENILVWIVKGEKAEAIKSYLASQFKTSFANE